GWHRGIWIDRLRGCYSTSRAAVATRWVIPLQAGCEWHSLCIPSAHHPGGVMADERNEGEGNREADRRYRKGVRTTVAGTTEEEREEKARDLTQAEREEAERAEEEGKSHAKR